MFLNQIYPNTNHIYYNKIKRQCTQPIHFLPNKKYHTQQINNREHNEPPSD